MHGFLEGPECPRLLGDGKQGWVGWSPSQDSACDTTHFDGGMQRDGGCEGCGVSGMDGRIEGDGGVCMIWSGC